MRLSAAIVLSLAMAGLGAMLSPSTTFAAARGANTPVFAGADSLDDGVLRLALNAAACARTSGAVKNERLLTVIDYSKASTEPRLWVLDLERERVLFEELVAHNAIFERGRQSSNQSWTIPHR